jgi:hypothetical protein
MTEFAATVDRNETQRTELPQPGQATVTHEETDDGKESIRVITVRLPASLHEALKDEAHQRKVSMNKLCINKLVQEMAELPSGQGSGRE